MKNGSIDDSDDGRDEKATRQGEHAIMALTRKGHGDDGYGDGDEGDDHDDGVRMRLAA